MALRFMDRELLINRIDSVLEHIRLVLNDTNDLSVNEIKESSLLLRATCFSIAQIGETMNQIEKELSTKYCDLPWIGARRMRNVIVHDYDGIDIEQVYSVIHDDLPILETAFLQVKEDLSLEDK